VYTVLFGDVFLRPQFSIFLYSQSTRFSILFLLWYSKLESS